MQRRQALAVSAMTVAGFVGGVLGVGRANGLFGADRPAASASQVAAESPVALEVASPAPTTTTTEAPPPAPVVHRRATTTTAAPRRVTTTTEAEATADTAPPATTVTTEPRREDHRVLVPVERDRDDEADD